MLVPACGWVCVWWGAVWEGTVTGLSHWHRLGFPGGAAGRMWVGAVTSSTGVFPECPRGVSRPVAENLTPWGSALGFRVGGRLPLSLCSRDLGLRGSQPHFLPLLTTPPFLCSPPPGRLCPHTRCRPTGRCQPGCGPAPSPRAPPSGWTVWDAGGT